MNKTKWSAIVGSCLLLASLLGASSASANASDPHDEGDLPRAAATLSASELAELGESQSPEQIDEVMSMASPEQNVQVLLNFDTKGYDAAVLVDSSPLEDMQSTQPAGALAEGSAAEGAARAGIYTCSYTSGPKGISNHTSTSYYWCGSGSWSGGPLAGWKQYYNGISTTALVGPSNVSWSGCPGFTTCTVPAGTNLGYVSFN